MSRVIAMALTVVVLFIMAPNVAEAYIGPGAGLSAIGTFIALIGAILLAVVGFVWYPLKRIRRKLAEKRKKIEEVIWRTFWPEKYTEGGIALWTAEDAQDEAAEFLREHAQKIVTLRCAERVAEGRYLSKNNGNIARIDLISMLLPDAQILVPVRRPLDHAASLLRQHKNFLAVHAQDSFARRYMADIGHYEFGALHRPICFPGLAALIEERDSTSLNYWLAYWIAAFEYVLSRRDSVIVVSYEDTCVRGATAIGEICERLGIDPGDKLEEIGAAFRIPTPHAVEEANADPALCARAEAVYSSLVPPSTRNH